MSQQNVPRAYSRIRLVRCLPAVALLALAAPSDLTWAMHVVLPTRGIAAHRGANFSHPENTLTAFQEAIDLGAHQIEFDVRRSADAQLVVIHDSTVDRTTNGSGRVARLTLAELKALDAGSWKHPRFTGERIPTLAETLDMMPHNIWLNVHLQALNPDRSYMAYDAAREIFAANRAHQAFLSLRHGVLGAQAAARTAGETILLNELKGQSIKTKYVNATIDRGSDFIQFFSPDSILPSPVDVVRLENAGVLSNYFGGSSLERKLGFKKQRRLTNLLNGGIDFPLVDDVATGIAVAQDLGIQPLNPIFAPEPGTGLLLVLGLACFLEATRRRTR